MSKTLNISGLGSAYQYFTSKNLIQDFLRRLSGFDKFIFVLEKNKTVSEKLTKYSEEEKIRELYK